jgi:hypothetical protein
MSQPISEDHLDGEGLLLCALDAAHRSEVEAVGEPARGLTIYRDTPRRTRATRGTGPLRRAGEALVLLPTLVTAAAYPDPSHDPQAPFVHQPIIESPQRLLQG